ncbi:DUF4283 domain protein [Medicago truncatula]|uniref:DUF4283 domain protein n=1 Tax=Medicago truncatula TaxID=3880 RepID=A0A072VR89_MEDTR|nr:DUF4283 domain protein [Medicago truncatula]
MTPLGRGFYEFFFASDDDMCMVYAKRTVNLKPGVLRLFEWTKDFNMHKRRNTHAQVWIRLLELPEEYWMDRTLQDIASDVGTPLLIDNVTSKRIYGHYARILVDMYFSHKLFHEITIEREDVVAQYAIVVTHEPIIILVGSLDVNSIHVDPDATVDPTLQKEINFMKTWLDKVAVNEGVSFSPIVSKSQKKKLAK